MTVVRLLTTAKIRTANGDGPVCDRKHWLQTELSVADRAVAKAVPSERTAPHSPLPIASTAVGSDEARNSSMRAASSPSPIAPAARPSA